MKKKKGTKKNVIQKDWEQNYGESYKELWKKFVQKIDCTKHNIEKQK